MALLDGILRRLRLERSLSVFRPVLVGPHAVGMARDGDAVQVCCHAPDMDRFRSRLSAMYQTLPGFSLDDTGCQLTLQAPVHIVGDPSPVRAQPTVRRHLFLVRLMRSLGPRFAQRLKGRRREGASLYETAAELMGVEDLLELEADNLVALRDRWRGTKATNRKPPPPTPTPPTPPPTPEPPVAVAVAPAPAVETDEESLLRQPSALLMRRDSRWVNAALVLGRKGRSGMELAKPPKREK